MIDWDKPLVTKSGLEARLIGMTLNPVSTFTHAVEVAGCIETYMSNGSYTTLDPNPMDPNPMDLVNAPVTHERFYNLYVDEAIGDPYPTKAETDRRCCKARSGILAVTFQDGNPVATHLYTRGE
jgi:hypothetical protein